MIFPSLKDKIKIFEDESGKREQAVPAQNKTTTGGNSMYVKRAELEKIVEEETKRRNPAF